MKMISHLGLSLLTLVGCSKNPIVDRVVTDASTGIVGGEPVSARDPFAKSVVGIYLDEKLMDRPFRQLCTGTLIAKNMVLTAAHCMDESIAADPKRYLITFGTRIIHTENDLNKIEIRKVVSKIVHTRWIPDPAITNEKSPLFDVAVLKFEGEAPAQFVPASWAASDLNVESGTQISVYGYGLIMEPHQNESQVLRKAQLEMKEWNFSETHFQTLSGPPSTCGGDSGGPAFLDDSKGLPVVVGITSFGRANCRQESYFTRVSAFSAWIASAVEDLKKGEAP